MTTTPTNPSPRITGVIVTYRSQKTISACLATARRCHEAGVMETVVVDNNTPSPDATREILAREAGFARVVLSQHNAGFGRGCNRGLAEVRTPYVVFINPDAVLEPDAVRAIVDFMDTHPRCGIAGPAVLQHEDASGKPVYLHVGGLLTPKAVVGDALGRGTSSRLRRPVSPGDAPFQTDWVSGAMLVGRVDVLRALGGFDPRYFLYYEETDLCRRCLAAGHEIWCIPSATAEHIGAVSAAEESDDRVKGCIAVHYYQSRFYYMEKHFGGLAARAATLAEFCVEPPLALLRSLLGKHKGPIFRRWRHPLWQRPRPAQEVAPL
ncbi:MAG TPA: glycosyltransferase family 2 protein [Phycisphaerales bacterium]|nr:glycosyltransferase family 2 protein [Phycisphaerales bacterium]